MPIQNDRPTRSGVAGGNPVAYAPHLRTIPLDGVATRRSSSRTRGRPDGTEPDLERIVAPLTPMIDGRSSVTTCASGRPTAPANPHTFLTNIATTAGDLAIAAQTQIAVFSKRTARWS